MHFILLFEQAFPIYCSVCSHVSSPSWRDSARHKRNKDGAPSPAHIAMASPANETGRTRRTGKSISLGHIGVQRYWVFLSSGQLRTAAPAAVCTSQLVLHTSEPGLHHSTASWPPQLTGAVKKHPSLSLPFSPFLLQSLTGS